MGQNNDWSMDIISQILPFVLSEFSVIITQVIFSLEQLAGKELVRDTLKELKIIWTTFKQMPHFFDNWIATFCSVHFQLHRLIASLLTDVKSSKIKHNGHTLNSHWPIVIFSQALDLNYLYMESTLVHTEDFRTPAQKKQLRNLLRKDNILVDKDPPTNTVKILH